MLYQFQDIVLSDFIYLALFSEKNYEGYILFIINIKMVDLGELR